MHERLQELIGTPLPSVEAASDMWERLQELVARSAAVRTADAARMAYNTTAAYAEPARCLGQVSTAAADHLLFGCDNGSKCLGCVASTA